VETILGAEAKTYRLWDLRRGTSHMHLPETKKILNWYCSFVQTLDAQIPTLSLL